MNKQVEAITNNKIFMWKTQNEKTM